MWSTLPPPFTRWGTASVNQSHVCGWQVKTSTWLVSDRSMNEPAALVPLVGSKLTSASSTITGRRSDRWPQLQDQPEAQGQEQLLVGAAAELLGRPDVACGVPDVDLGTAQRGVRGLIRAVGDVEEEALGVADHIRLPLLLELALRPLDQALGNRSDPHCLK